MIRRCTAAALVVLVQMGATFAPLVHVHAGDRGTGHHAQPAHAHLPTGPDAPVVDHGDEGRPLAPQVFVAVAVDPADAPAVPAAAFVLVVPPELAGRRAPRVSHGHDPPFVPQASSRAPPSASLS